MTGMLSVAGQILTVICVLILAYFCSRLLGRNWIKASTGRHIRVIDQISLGQDKKIALLELGERHYLVGVSQAGIQLLAEIDGELDEKDGEPAEFKTANFGELMKKYSSLYQRKKGGDR